MKKIGYRLGSTIFAFVFLLAWTGAAKAQSLAAVPMIQMSHVPVTTAIEQLAQMARINFQLDPKLFKAEGNAIAEPIVTFAWTNLSSEEALTRLLKEHGLVLLKNQSTTVARIMSTNHPPLAGVDMSLLGDRTNAIPLIQFADASLTICLENLAREARVNYVLDPKSFGQLGKDGKIREEPVVSVRWEKLSAKQALAALCENYGLVITKDAKTDWVRIKSKE